MKNETLIAALNTEAQRHEQQYHESTDPGEQKHHAKRARTLTRALHEANQGNVPEFIGVAVWLVQSKSHAGEPYRVDLDAGSCNCQAGLNSVRCWHLEAVLVAASVKGVVVPDEPPDYGADLAAMDGEQFLTWLGCKPVTA